MPDENTNPSPTHGRLFFVDWLRIAAFALLVLYHVGMLYVPWHFHVKQTPTYAALEPLMRLSNPWRMGLLFVISGVATGLMLGRPGLARERSKRLLLPLVLGMTVIVPPQAWFQAREQFGFTAGYLDFLRLYFGLDQGGLCNARECLVLPTWNHLWFLPYLWCYTMLGLLAVRFIPAGGLRSVADRLAHLPGWVLLVMPVLLLGTSRALLFPRFGETHALVNDWAAHAAYLPLFAWGLLMARRRQLLAQLQALRWPALVLGLAAWAVLVLYQGASLRWAFAAAQWGGIVAAFGFARAHLDRDHRWRAALTQAVFPIYLVHQTVVIVAAVALRPLALPAGLEAWLIIMCTVVVGAAAWQLARRVRALRPWMGLPRASPSQSASPAERMSGA